MRKLAMSTVLVTLLGACTSLTPPAPAPRPQPVATPEARSEPQPTPSPRVATQRPREIRIDNTSIDTFRASWQRLHASLSPTQQASLNDAVAHLTFARYGGGANLPGNLRNSPIVPEIIRDQIAGMTYAEIIALSP